LIEKPLYNFITNLHLRGDLELYDNILDLNNSDRESSSAFLEKQFNEEKIENNHLFKFEKESAIIAASSIFNIAHLIYFRELDMKEVDTIIEPIKNLATSPQSILSADLMLRFLPQITNEIKAKVPSDEIITHLEIIMSKWHFSSINYNFENLELNFSDFEKNKELYAIYKKRIIQFKNIKLGSLPIFYKEIKSEFGNYGDLFWKELMIENE
jgi:hypothetical protein